MFPQRPSYTNYGKAASNKNKPRGLWDAVVTRVVQEGSLYTAADAIVEVPSQTISFGLDGLIGSNVTGLRPRVYAKVPRLVEGFEFGPLELVGPVPNPGDRAFVAFKEGDPDYMVLFAKGDQDLTLEKVAEKTSATVDVVADFGAVGDGSTDDFVAIQAAIEAVEAAGGGDVFFPPKIYGMSAGASVTAQVPIRLVGYGATLQAIATDIDLLRISQDQVFPWNYYGIVEGLKFDGDNQAGVTGVTFADTVRAELRQSSVRDCLDTGVKLVTQGSGEWTELCVVEGVFISDCGTGLSIDNEGGNTSNAIHRIQSVYINGSSPGFHCSPNTHLSRSLLGVNVWIDATSTQGVIFDGNIEHIMGHVTVESFSGSGTTGVEFGSNTDLGFNLFDLQLNFIGTFANKIVDNTSGLSYGVAFRQGNHFYNLDTAKGALNVWNDIDDDLPEVSIFPDGRVSWHNPAGPTYDVANIRAGSGTPESSVTANPGSLYMDYGNGTLYVKSSGTGNTGWAALAEV